jgi:hypothetical protein
MRIRNGASCTEVLNARAQYTIIEPRVLPLAPGNCITKLTCFAGIYSPE